MLSKILKRIESAFDEAALVIRKIDPALMEVRRKASGDLVTQVDMEINRVLQEVLLQPGEGWLSEESPDDSGRLKMERVWIIDPLDGTKEFVSGNPEWAVSVAWIQNGKAVAGGVWNPAKGELFLGAAGLGTTLNGVAVSMSGRIALQGAHVLASRTEVAAGDWRQFENTFRVDAVGSIAYKLALVAAGRADATWTMGPRNEWDLAAGAALIEASGGVLLVAGGAELRFNQQDPLMPQILAANIPLTTEFLTMAPWKQH